MQASASQYDAAYAAWQRDPDGYWREAARRIDWDRAPDRILDPAAGPYGRWFPDARLNTCHNAVDRHVASGRGGQAAIIWDSPMTGRCETITYAALQSRVAKLAGALRARGVGAGDRVVVYMPMVPEAAIAMLACARLGAVHSVVFGGFAAAELAARIADAKPKVVLAASCGLEPGRVVAYKPLLDAAIALSPHKPDRVLVLQREQSAAALEAGRDEDWSEAEAAAAPADCVPVAATDPLYILYTSGTTGKPKGVVRDNGGHAVALRNSMAMLYGVGPGDVMFTASDVGWVVGHSYIVYAPLLTGATSVLFEGKPVGTPDAGTFWRVCAQHGVKAMFTAPTAIRAIKRDDPEGRLVAQHDLSRLEALFLAGERCDPPTAEWVSGLLRKPVIDHWWQTETGWPISGNFRGLGLFPARFGSGGKASPGYDVQALDEAGQPLPRGQGGTLAVRLPLPPGCLPTLWQADDRFRESYTATFPGWYNTSDAGVVDEEGYISVMSRTDDIINVAGHRLSTGAMEEVLASHPDVAECAVVGVKDSLKGQVPLGLVVLKSGVTRAEDAICRDLVGLVRDRIGPVAAFKDAKVVPRLPKTRSGKILRATLRRIADGEDYVVPPTIDDPAILGEMEGTLKGVAR
ncbi:AMP-binding protein [Paracraurococcus ruber]|uniref:Propionyl-CoA synthetase n=1 Tax=Paracraurococcus ruber TaxID=77675 RepID=A0ABS1CRR2_9PROT|nr:AMP-binding protein [Paracraurococcus ruber]MBK1657048.1 propionyl-CoA synthetase [Paracraurococcus ruber]TDG31475.1 propionyl-CoA synthetase [Paracraurococcus ruber]